LINYHLISLGPIKSDPNNNGMVKKLSLIINLRVYLTAVFITYPLIFPVFILLYSSTRGSITLYQTEGKNDINMQTEYPCGK
jgi:hypothetical protein